MATAANVPLGQVQPLKPLKILTLDGGGLQAISALLILNQLLEAIAKGNGVLHKKPRPCDVFDVIAGIGAGGWLAILLGRFRMDITSCLSEWYRLMECIAPRSRSEELRLRLLQHCYFDTDRLVEQVHRLTETYGTGDLLYENDPEGARTRHVFVAALKSDARGYNLFRSYETPKSPQLPKHLLEGPKDPESFNISRAFAVTGAAKYFSPPWTEHMANSGMTRFSDTWFPKPHNITELALNEMWAIYGTEVPISAVVNVGPGLPQNLDVKRIARRFSWGLKTVTAHTGHSRFGTRLGTRNEQRQEQHESVPFPQPDDLDEETKGISVRFEDPKGREDTATNLNSEYEPKLGMVRRDTVGSIRDRGIEVKLRRLESDIERDVKDKLNNVYPQGSSLYYRLALDKAPEGCPRNDSFLSGAAFDATMGYLREPRVHLAIDQVIKRLPDVAPIA